MDMTQGMTAQPAAPMEAEGPKELYTICIECYEDGTFKVGKDTPEETPEAMPGTQGAPEAATEDDGYQPAATADEALAIAGNLLSEKQTSNTSASLQSGYNKGRGMPFQQGGM